MGLKLPRQKPKNLKLRFAYRLAKLLTPLGPARKARILLDWAWICNRLAHEACQQAAIPHNPTSFVAFLKRVLDPTMRVLDLGCGDGKRTETIAPFADCIVGVDTNATAIAKAVQRAIPNAQFYTADALAFLNQNPTPFDASILSHVLEHLDDPLALLQHLHNHTTWLFVEVPDYQCSWLNEARAYLQTDLIYSDADHIHEFDRDDIQTLAQQAGWQIVHDEYRYGVMRFWLRAVG